jgi:hypothetical protein
MASQDRRISLQATADDEPVGSGVTRETMDEMTLLAFQRAAATGKPAFAGCFTGASEATVGDLEPEEPDEAEEPDEPEAATPPVSRVARSFTVPLEHPSPSLGQTFTVLVRRVVDTPAARPRTTNLRPRERRERRACSRGGDCGDPDLADEPEPPPERGAA